MRIGLIDIDGHNYPNLPLMKLSRYHKNNGDNVEWYMPFSDKYDRVYCSKVFSYSEYYADHINADEVICGGSGYNIALKNNKEVYVQNPTMIGDRIYWDTLPYEIEHIMPDYSIYKINDTAYGFLTRGCPRQCSFCHVASKEGTRSIKVANLSEFWDKQKNIVLCDPNILACKDCNDLLQQLVSSRAYVDFNQGLDARLLTKEKADKLSKIRVRNIHFAWDKYDDRDLVIKGLETYAESINVKPKSNNAQVYTLVNYDTTFEQDLDRIYTLRQLGYYAYVMIYDKQHCERRYKQLQRWCNNRIIFGKCERFEDYKG